MKKVLKSNSTYKTFNLEDFRIIAKVDTKNIETGVKATLTVYVETITENGSRINRLTTSKSYVKEFTKVEVDEIEADLNLDASLNSFEKLEAMELAAAASFIESELLFEINGTPLVAADFSTVLVEDILVQ